MKVAINYAGVAKYFADIRVWYANLALLLSIAAHEAFHILAHGKYRKN